MSATNVAALTIAAVIAVGFSIAVCRAGRRIQREEEARQAAWLATRIPDPASMPTVPVAAVVDTEPGFNLDLADEWDRILAATNDREAELEAGCERLRAALRDEKAKGD